MGGKREVFMRLRRVAGALAAVGLLGASLVSTVGAQTAPSAVDDTATVPQGQSVIINVLANDSPAGVTIASVGTPSNGTAIIASGAVVYTPKQGFHGTDSFPYTITDGSATATATVTIAVTKVNRPPVAKPDSATTTPGTAVTINVLKNDKDPDGDTLAVVLVSQPSNGTAVLDAVTQKVTYTPNAGFEGTDSFTYFATDGEANSDVVTVTVTVKQKVSKPAHRDVKVLVACEAYAGPGNGVATLCEAYAGDQLPVFVRAKLGVLILRLVGPQDEVAAICARSDNPQQLTRLCETYQGGALPYRLQRALGHIIVAADASLSSSGAVPTETSNKPSKPWMKP
jgi:hypothetical protein